MNCSACGSQIPNDNSVCPECGATASDSQNDTPANKYYCEACGEELEFITAYKQWYCYNCQTYEDLPPPMEASDTLETTKTNEIIEPEHDLDQDNNSESDIEPDTPISWDEETSSDVSADDIADNETRSESDDELVSTEPSIDAGDNELSWDDAVDVGSVETIADEDLEDEYESETDSDEELINGSSDSSKLDVDTETVTTGESEPENDTTDEFIIAGPIAGVDLESDTIENLSADDVIVEIDEDYAPPEDTIELSEHEKTVGKEKQDLKLKKKSMEKLHQAWLKVNNLKSLNPKDPRVLQLEDDLKRALEGNFDARDGIVIAAESIEEAEKLEKELKGIIHQQVSDLFHFASSKLILARKIGFELEALEEELDNITSLIARSEYHRAQDDLETFLQKMFDLPKSQDEIMIGLDPHSDIILELLEPWSKDHA